MKIPQASNFGWQSLFSRGMILLLFLAVILFRISVEMALWERHRWQLAGAVVLIVLETFLIGALLIERSRRQQVTIEMASSERRNKAFLRALPDMFFIQDMSGVIVDFHVKNLADLSVPPESFVGRNYSDLLPADVSEQIGECVSRVKLSDEAQTVECEIRLGGIERHFEARLTRCDEQHILSIVRDVTERSQAEQSLRERDHLLGAILNSLSSHVAVVDSEGIITYTSRSWREFGRENAGIPDRVAVGMNYLKVCAGAADDPSATEALVGISAVIEGKIPSFSCTYTCHSPDTRRWFMMKADPMPAAHGGVVISHIDISERRKAEEALRSSEERFEKAFRASPTAFMIGRLSDGLILDVNESWSELLGFDRNAVSGIAREDVCTYVNPEDRALIFDNLAIGKGIRNCEIALHTSTGEVRHVLASAEPVTLNGEACFLKMLNDVTDLRKTEEAVRQIGEFNRQIVESTMDCVKIMDLDGCLLYVNKYGQEALEISDLNKYLSKSWINLWPAETQAVAGRAIKRAAQGSVGAFQGSARTENGNLKWWDNLITPIRGANGQVERLLGVSRDITEVTLATQAVQESEERFANVFKFNPQPMSLVGSEDYRILDVNDSYLALSGYKRDEIVGRNSIEFGIWENARTRGRFHECFENGKPLHNIEVEFNSKDGVSHVLLVSADALEFGGHKCILSAASDITERKQLEEKLSQSEREFSTLVQNSPDTIARLDNRLKYIYVSPSLERNSGSDALAFLGKTPSEVKVRGFNASAIESAARNALTTGKTIALDTTFRERNFWTRVIPERALSGEIESLMLISQDVTERLRTERELKVLTQRLFHLQEEERRRIARELHDETAQDLFAITLNLAKIRHSSTVSETEMNFLIDECQMLGEQSLKEIRTMSYLLHPPMLDQAGLVSAVQWYVEGFNKRSGLRVNVQAQAVGRLPSEIESALFRVVQESLTNVRRHSGSETASIRLERTSEEVVLEIIDHGLSAKKRVTIPDDETDLGVGIPGMRERMHQVGGRLEVVSTDTGTKVAAVVPLDRSARTNSYAYGI